MVCKLRLKFDFKQPGMMMQVCFGSFQLEVWSNVEYLLAINLGEKISLQGVSLGVSAAVYKLLDLPLVRSRAGMGTIRLGIGLLFLYICLVIGVHGIFKIEKVTLYDLSDNFQDVG